MVIIVSRTEDASTNEVMDWLSYYGEQVVRINENASISNLTVEINNINLLDLKSAILQWT